MKMNQNITRFGSARALCALLLSVSAAALSNSSAATPPAGSTDPKTHTLFMGADVQVQYENSFYKVEDIEGGSFVIKVKGKPVKIAAESNAVKLKVDRSLKLTGTSMTIDRLKAERAYTPGNDPTKKFLNEQGNMMARQDALADKSWSAGQAQMMRNVMTAASGPTGKLGFETADPIALDHDVSQEYARSLSDFGNDGVRVGKMQDDLVDAAYDAMRVEFEISAPQRARKPYVIVMVQYHLRDGKPGESKNWIYAAALDPMEGSSQRFSILKGGFPPGFVLEKQQIHVYDSGSEVATNVSDKRVPLTQSEAFTYLTLEYLSSHKSDTARPKPLMGKLSPEAKAQLSSDQLNATYYVKVNKDGLPDGVYIDSDCSRPVDDSVGAIVKSVRFYPALEKGKPADGVSELKLNRIPL